MATIPLTNIVIYFLFGVTLPLAETDNNAIAVIDWDEETNKSAIYHIKMATENSVYTW